VLLELLEQLLRVHHSRKVRDHASCLLACRQVEVGEDDSSCRSGAAYKCTGQARVCFKCRVKDLCAYTWLNIVAIIHTQNTTHQRAP
jgi:hypothetical protein